MAGGINGDVGIWVQESTPTASSPSGTLIQGNYVGLDQSGTLARGFTTGIRVNGIGTVIGGTAAGAGNVVAGNVSHNILIEPYATTVQGNLIGTNAAGTSAIRPSTTFGVLAKAPGTIVGGTTTAARNVVSGHSFGVTVSGSNAVDVTGVTVQGNYIGTDATGLSAIPNGHGVYVDKAGSSIGGTTASARNVISGNANGLYIAQTSWGPISALSVFGNWIGLNAAGAALGNTGQGVFIDAGVTGVAIGGVGAGQANVIAHSGGRGVLLNAPGSAGIVVRGNRIDANGSLAHRSRRHATRGHQ